MQLPVQITFRDVKSSSAIAEHIHRRCEKLDGLFDRLMSCRIAIESPNRHSSSGRHFHVRIDLTLPGAELVTGRHHANQLDNDPHVAVDRAFDEMERLVRDHASKIRVQRRNGTPRGRVLRVFHDRGYGFLESTDGREIYFHEHSVLHGKFGQIAIGTPVRYAEEDGDKGPQASTVEIVGAPHASPAWHAEEVRDRPSMV